MSRAARSDIVDLTLVCHARSNRAIKVSETGDRAKAVWLPLSQIEIDRIDGAVVTLACPEWLAIEKGLI